MKEMSRRELMRVGGKLAALIGLGSGAVARVVEAVEALAAGTAPVLWLQAQTCSGCSVTTLNCAQPGPAEILTRYISLRFHSTLSASSGELSMQVINQTIDKGDFFLVVEGSIPAGMPEACIVGNENIDKQVLRAAAKAKAIIALGTCAVFGGIPAAEGNPTGAVSLVSFLKNNRVDKPTISLPGCPPHPDWLLGTLVHVLKFGLPPLDAEGRPKMFYSKLVHDQCPRFADYERENFAKTFSDDGCLFKIGCLGPNTHADCMQRMWNGGTNYCIKAGAPCIGCTSKEFAAKASFPFFRKGTAGERNRQKGEA